MVIGVDPLRERLLHGKGLDELKRTAIRLNKRMCELHRFIASGRRCWRNPSYSRELITTQLRIELINKRIDEICRYGEKEMGNYPIDRFLTAQEGIYAQALAELQAGRKTGHWMWYVFPQLRFLGQSEKSHYYGIADETEAKAYCANALLHGRYIECCKMLESLSERNPERIMGRIDAWKLRSSLTLFYMVDEQNKDLYEKLIYKFYCGKWDLATVDYLARRRSVDMRLTDEPFQQIKQYQKRIEVRLYDEKRRKFQVGNLICFTNTKNQEKMQARIVDLHQYDTFEELFENVGLKACGFGGYTVDSAIETMRSFYSVEEEQRYGVVGIELTLDVDG